MRVNVGSIAPCRTEEEAAWVSPDYAVFRLTEDAPFDLMFLKSEQGRAEIEGESRGAVRRRLYIDGLQCISVPLPGEPEAWSALIASIASARRHMRKLSLTASGASRSSRPPFSARA